MVFSFECNGVVLKHHCNFLPRVISMSSRLDGGQRVNEGRPTIAGKVIDLFDRQSRWFLAIDSMDFFFFCDKKKFAVRKRNLWSLKL